MALKPEVRKEIQEMMAFAFSDATRQNDKVIEVISEHVKTNINILHAMEESNRQIKLIGEGVTETARALNNGLSTKIKNIESKVTTLENDFHGENGAIPVMKKSISGMQTTQKALWIPMIGMILAAVVLSASTLKPEPIQPAITPRSQIEQIEDAYQNGLQDGLKLEIDSGE